MSMERNPSIEVTLTLTEWNVVEDALQDLLEGMMASDMYTAAEHSTVIDILHTIDRTIQYA